MLMLPLLVAAAGVTASPSQAPPPGHYDARMCVSVNTQPANCGPVEAHLSPEGELTLRVDDIRYLLSFEQGLLLGQTLHGNMLVADFLSSYRWVGTTLMFGDKRRGLQYEVQLTPPDRRAPKP